MHFDITIIESSAPMFGRGLLNTIVFCAVAIAIGLICGSTLALGRLSQHKLPNYISGTFVELVRNTPFLVQIFLLYYASPAIGIRLNATTAGIIALSAYASGYFAEAIRGAIQSVPRGQMESARALGLPYLLAMRRVVAPQMMPYLVPALTNQMIGLVKQSAVLSVITVPETMMAAQRVLGETFAPVEVYTAAAMIYWALTAVLNAAMSFLEQRYRIPTSGRGNFLDSRTVIGVER